MTLYIVVALLVAAAIAFLLLKKKKGLGFGKKSATTTEVKESPSFLETTVKTTAIDDQLRRDIENNIRHQNYQVAEAQINAALHQDDTQHDLYHLLADVYLHQDDELAFKQLIDHLQESRLYNLVDELNLRKEAFQKQQTQQAEFNKTQKASMTETAVVGGAIIAGTTAGAMDFDNLLSTPSGTTTTDNNMDFAFSEPKTETSDNSLNFDSLLSAPVENNNAVNFDDLLSASTPTESPKAEVNELDFSFSSPLAIETPKVAESNLDFAVNESTPATQTVETTDLDLSFSTPAVETPKAEESFDFSFNEPAPAVEAPKAEESFDFSFNEPTPVVETPKAEENFDFSFNESTPIVETPKAEENFDFSFNEPAPVVETPKAEENFDFSFNEPTTVEIVEEIAPTTEIDLSSSFAEPAVQNIEPVSNFDLNDGLVVGGAVAAATLTNSVAQHTTSHDPLMNQFPILSDYHEITVNLKLANQYVNLGAYEAAHNLLAHRDNFTEQQNQQADAILARINA